MRTRGTAALCLLIVGGWASIPTPTIAGDAALSVITPALIQRYVDWAQTNHPGLQAARARTDAAKWAIGAIKKWEDPVAKVGGVGSTARGSRLSEDGDLFYGVEQRLPLFGKYQAKTAVAEQEWSMAQKTADYQFQILRREIAKALFRIGLSVGRIQSADKELVQTEIWATMADQRYAAGGGSQIETLRLRAEISKLHSTQQARKQELSQEQASLNRMLGRDPLESLPQPTLPDVFADLPYSSGLADLAIRYEPKLQLLNQEINTAEARVSMARTDRRPDVALGMEGRHYSSDGGLRGGNLTLAFSMPWFHDDKNRKNISKEKARVEAARLESVDYQLAIREEIHRLTTLASVARRRALLYQDEVIPRAQLIIQTASTAWMANRGQFNELMEGRRMLLEAQQLGVESIAEQYLALSELVLCCGLSDFDALEMFRENATSPTPSTTPSTSSPSKP